MGLRFTARVNPQLEFTSQLLSRARVEGWDVKADWAFAEYKLNKNVSVRAGRVRLPLQLASEYVEVGHAYPWVRPPTEVYRMVAVNAISGVSVPLKANIGNMDLVVQPMAGTLELTTKTSGLDISLTEENIAAASIDLSNDILRLHAAYLTAKVNGSASVPIPICDPTIPYPGLGSCPPGLGVITGDLDVTLLDASDYNAWDVGMTVNWNNILLMTEYVHVYSGPALDDQFGWYATLGYEMGNFLPYVTYAERRSDKVVDDPSTVLNEPFLLSGLSRSQNTVAVGLRYNVSNTSTIKLEILNGAAQDDTCGLIDSAGAGTCSGDFPVNGSYNMYSVAYDVTF
jgi:hypothetical protein